MLKEPKDYTKEDYGNYAHLMVKTNAIYCGNNPNSSYPKSCRGKNGIIDLKTFGSIGESMKEAELLLFRANLMLCLKD